MLETMVCFPYLRDVPGAHPRFHISFLGFLHCYISFWLFCAYVRWQAPHAGGASRRSQPRENQMKIHKNLMFFTDFH